MTDFRACGTIMGPTGLTAVFGMGTGVAPPVWSPGRRPPGSRFQPGRSLGFEWLVDCRLMPVAETCHRLLGVGFVGVAHFDLFHDTADHSGSCQKFRE